MSWLWGSSSSEKPEKDQVLGQCADCSRLAGCAPTLPSDEPDLSALWQRLKAGDYGNATQDDLMEEFMVSSVEMCRSHAKTQKKASVSEGSLRGSREPSDHTPRCLLPAETIISVCRWAGVYFSKLCAASGNQAVKTEAVTVDDTPVWNRFNLALNFLFEASTSSPGRAVLRHHNGVEMIIKWMNFCSGYTTDRSINMGLALYGLLRLSEMSLHLSDQYNVMSRFGETWDFKHLLEQHLNQEELEQAKGNLVRMLPIHSRVWEFANTARAEDGLLAATAGDYIGQSIVNTLFSDIRLGVYTAAKSEIKLFCETIETPQLVRWGNISEGMDETLWTVTSEESKLLGIIYKSQLHLCTALLLIRAIFGPALSAENQQSLEASVSKFLIWITRSRLRWQYAEPTEDVLFRIEEYSDSIAFAGLSDKDQSPPSQNIDSVLEHSVEDIAQLLMRQRYQLGSQPHLLFLDVDDPEDRMTSPGWGASHSLKCPRTLSIALNTFLSVFVSAAACRGVVLYPSNSPLDGKLKIGKGKSDQMVQHGVNSLAIFGTVMGIFQVDGDDVGLAVQDAEDFGYYSRHALPDLTMAILAAVVPLMNRLSAELKHTVAERLLRVLSSSLFIGPSTPELYTHVFVDIGVDDSVRENLFRCLRRNAFAYIAVLGLDVNDDIQIASEVLSTCIRTQMNKDSQASGEALLLSMIMPIISDTLVAVQAMADFPLHENVAIANPVLLSTMLTTLQWLLKLSAHNPDTHDQIGDQLHAIMKYFDRCIGTHPDRSQAGVVPTLLLTGQFTDLLLLILRDSKSSENTYEWALLKMEQILLTLHLCEEDVSRDHVFSFLDLLTSDSQSGSFSVPASRVASVLNALAFVINASPDHTLVNAFVDAAGWVKVLNVLNLIKHSQMTDCVPEQVVDDGSILNALLNCVKVCLEVSEELRENYRLVGGADLLEQSMRIYVGGHFRLTVTKCLVSFCLVSAVIADVDAMTWQLSSSSYGMMELLFTVFTTMSDDARDFFIDSLVKLVDYGMDNRSMLCHTGALKHILLLLTDSVLSDKISDTQFDQLWNTASRLGVQSVRKSELKILFRMIVDDRAATGSPRARGRIMTPKVLRLLHDMGEAFNPRAYLSFNGSEKLHTHSIPGFPGSTGYGVLLWVRQDQLTGLSKPSVPRYHRQQFLRIASQNNGDVRLYLDHEHLIVEYKVSNNAVKQFRSEIALPPNQWNCVVINHCSSWILSSRSSLFNVIINGSDAGQCHVPYVVGNKNPTSLDFGMWNEHFPTVEDADGFRGQLAHLVVTDTNLRGAREAKSGTPVDPWITRADGFLINKENLTVWDDIKCLHLNAAASGHGVLFNLASKTYRMCDGVPLLVHVFHCKSLAQLLHGIGGMQLLNALVPVLYNNEETTPGTEIETPETERLSWSAHEKAPLIQFLDTITALLKYKNNRDLFVSSGGLATLAEQLRSLSSMYLTSEVIHRIREIEGLLSAKTLRDYFYPEFVFDFGLWVDCSAEVQSSHLQYVTTIIKDHLSDYRAQYGVQYILDTLRRYYYFEADGTEFGLHKREAVYLQESQEAIVQGRQSLLALLTFFMREGVKSVEVEAILSFITDCPDVRLRVKMLDHLMELSLHHSQSDILGPLVDAGGAQVLYGLLRYSNNDLFLKERALDMLLTINSDPRLSKSQQGKAILSNELMLMAISDIMDDKRASMRIFDLLWSLALRRNLGDREVADDLKVQWENSEVLPTASLTYPGFMWAIHRLLLQEQRENVVLREMSTYLGILTSTAKHTLTQVDENKLWPRLLTQVYCHHLDLIYQKQVYDDDAARDKAKLAVDIMASGIAVEVIYHSFLNPVPAKDPLVNSGWSRLVFTTVMLDLEVKPRWAQWAAAFRKQLLSGLGMRFINDFVNPSVREELKSGKGPLSGLPQDAMKVALLTLDIMLKDNYGPWANFIESVTSKSPLHAEEGVNNSNASDGEGSTNVSTALMEGDIDMDDGDVEMASMGIVFFNLMEHFGTILFPAPKKFEAQFGVQRGQLVSALSFYYGMASLLHPNLDICAKNAQQMRGFLNAGLVHSGWKELSLASVGMLDSMITTCLRWPAYNSHLDILTGLLNEAILVTQNVTNVLYVASGSPLSTGYTPAANTSTSRTIELVESTAWRQLVDQRVRPAVIAVHGAVQTGISQGIKMDQKKMLQSAGILVATSDNELRKSIDEMKNLTTKAVAARRYRESSRFRKVVQGDLRTRFIIARQWRDMMAFWQGPRGILNYGGDFERKWRLDRFENPLRMRLKLIESEAATSHEEASRLRDEGAAHRSPSPFQMKQSVAESPAGSDYSERTNDAAVREATKLAQHNPDSVNREVVEDGVSRMTGDEGSASELSEVASVAQSTADSNASPAKVGRTRRLTRSSSIWGLTNVSRLGDDHDDASLEMSGMSLASDEMLRGADEILYWTQCDMITLLHIVRGRIEVTARNLTFMADRDIQPQNSKEEYISRDTAPRDFKFKIASLRDVQLRRYLTRPSALELFFVDGTSCFLNFTSKERPSVCRIFRTLAPPNLRHSDFLSPQETMKRSKLTEQWVAGKISNYQYLMELNTIAGRTFNDLNQYPVFPWVIADYSSQKLDLTDPHTYRDLSKPIGALNPDRLEIFKERYHSFEDPSGVVPKFHYGSHYSTSAGVLHFLIRLEPFTTLHINLQGGRFDYANRQFVSIPATWYNVTTSSSDVKELIPEFYSLPDFLRNLNDLDLGVTQRGKVVNDVELPPWAKTPEEFIRINRKALESEYVSLHLHHWIDLIFGCKQRGKAAADAHNVFYYLTYENAIDLDKVTDPRERQALETQIGNFGQTPAQLFTGSHPARSPFPKPSTRINPRMSANPETVARVSPATAVTASSTPTDSKAVVSAMQLGPLYGRAVLSSPWLLKAFSLDVGLAGSGESIIGLGFSPAVPLSAYAPDALLATSAVTGGTADKAKGSHTPADRLVALSSHGFMALCTFVPQSGRNTQVPFTVTLEPFAAGISSASNPYALSRRRSAVSRDTSPGDGGGTGPGGAAADKVMHHAGRDSAASQTKEHIKQAQAAAAAASEAVSKGLAIDSRFARDFKLHPGSVAWDRAGRFVLCCGYWDHTFKLFPISGGGMPQWLQQRVPGHTDVVTCIALDPYGGPVVATGSHDTTVMLWELKTSAQHMKAGSGPVIKPTPLQVLYGHDHGVTAVALNGDENVVVSGSHYGVLLVHSISNGQYLRTLNVALGDSASPRGGAEQLSLRATTSTMSARSSHRHSPVRGSISGQLHGGSVRSSTVHEEDFHGSTSASVVPSSITCLICGVFGSIYTFCEADNVMESHSALAHYSLNGQMIARQFLLDPLEDMNLSHANEFVIAASRNCSIYIFDGFHLNAIYRIPMQAPIRCLRLAQAENHLFIGLADGRLVVAAVPKGTGNNAARHQTVTQHRSSAAH
eukprot:Clim_evm65s25 gene=Clim_evmTU65s25